ncbi:hypothetical protein GALL_259310 [mine drainage metagenome]|uniref:Uncharacterized protein n=1 Tax=mine drainage metagenome TaxID=410659 RepID=A0A1J5R8A8_9ZZZZ
MIIAVSWSSTWLMVTICPSFISTLMTSDAFTAILCARSPTVMVSGTCTSRTWGSAGATKRGCSFSRESRREPPLAPRQAAVPPLVSPRVLMARRLAASSAQEDDNCSDLTCFFALASAAPAPAVADAGLAGPAAGL